MARDASRKLREETGKNSKQQRREVGSRGSSRTRNKLADPAVRRRTRLETDPRLVRAREEKEAHEAELRALEAERAAQPAQSPGSWSLPAPESTATVLQMPTPTPDPVAEVVALREHVGFVNLSQPKPAPAPKAPAPGRYTSRKPDQEAWRLALRLADGDVQRIEVLDPLTLLVRNRPV